MHRGPIARRASLTALAALAASVLTSSASASPVHASYRYVTVTSETGVSLHQSSRAVEQRVLNSLRPGSRLLSVRVVPNRAGVGKTLQNGIFIGPEAAKEGPAWIVDFRGVPRGGLTFPGGSLMSPVARDGYVVIDDETGSVLESGYGKSG